MDCPKGGGDPFTCRILPASDFKGPTYLDPANAYGTTPLMQTCDEFTHIVLRLDMPSTSRA